MKNIIFVISSLESGGAERVLAILANMLAEKSYEITIITKLNKKPFYELNKKITIIHPKTNISYYSISKRIISTIKAYYEIFTYLRKNKSDVVISFCTNTNGIMILICKLLKLKIIVCEHNNYIKNLNNIINHFIKRILYPVADILTVLTERDRKEYYSNFMSNVIVMENPLSLTVKQSNNINKTEKIILSIGNLTKWHHKGLDTLIKIFSRLSVKNKDWILNIAGSGNPEYISTLIKKYEIADKIILLGEVNEIQELLNKASIFVLTSRYEGLPMVLIEAMSQGLPCIAFDCFTGPRDIISHNYDGLLVEDQNEEEFLNILEKVIINTELQIELGNNARKSSMKYDKNNILKKWESLFSELEYSNL